LREPLDTSQTVIESLTDSTYKRSEDLLVQVGVQVVQRRCGKRSGNAKAIGNERKTLGGEDPNGPMTR
jgi:hypothetical protein